MTDLELIFTMLGERVTAEISHNERPETFDKSRKVARRGAGKQRSNQNGSSDLEARKRLLLPGL